MLRARLQSSVFSLPSQLLTDAIVLHTFDYLETSRIVRLLTRDAGVRSAVARGARHSKRRFGTSIDLFAQGTAEFQSKPGRELDTLTGFEGVRGRPQLGEDLARFAAAAVIAELVLRFAIEDSDHELFDVVAETLDALASDAPAHARALALAGGWRILATAGFAPSLDDCADCHAPIQADAPALFSHASGGVVCATCARQRHAGRTIPAAARATIRAWLAGERAPVETDEARSHQRLLREFALTQSHDGKPLRAYAMWEHGAWSDI
jgi:DNA repair protein RecO (recombination protein O)